MIKRFNQYIKESHLDIDPFGEEDWDDDEICVGDFVEVNGKLMDHVNGPKMPNVRKLSPRVLVLIGKIHKVLNIDHINKLIFIDEYAIPLDCVKKVE